MADITEVKRALEGRAKAVAEYLLPNGILQGGREWAVGSIGGEPGKSMKVCVKGAKVGTWCDFADGGESGDLIDLWQAVRRQTLVEALDDIRKWLGMEAPVFERKEKTYRLPDKPKCTAPKSAVLAYLTNERKLTLQAISAYRVGEDGKTIVLPSLLPGGALAFVKYLGVDRDKDGKKITRVEAGCEPVLFGWQAIPENAREITITEGEIDAISAWDYGYPAMSVPFGGGKGNKQAWIESEFDRMSRFEVIYLAMDMDDEGNSAVAEISDRLGRHRCRRVMLPRKDMNECRKAGIEKQEIDAAFNSAVTLDPDELRRAGAFTDEVVGLFWPSHDQEPGYRLPWGKVNGKLSFRSGEMTVWTGPSGSGKSQLLSHACVGFGDQGSRACIASLEMAPRQSLRRMVKQAGNVDRPTEPYIRDVMAWMDGWLWMFNFVGKASVTKIIEVFEYARSRYGCDVFVVDSLMRLGVGSEDYEGQERAVFHLVSWAVEKNVHVHLVAHSRKADTKFGGNSAPETEDIKGASEIGSNAFNIIGVWRNRKAEDAIKELEEKSERGDGAASMKLAEAREVPTVIVNIAKQRNGDWEGKFGLWFCQETYQYRSSHDDAHGRSYVARTGDYGDDAAF